MKNIFYWLVIDFIGCTQKPSKKIDVLFKYKEIYYIL